MLSLAIRNLFARKFRAISTASSVFFGVSMVSGTLFIYESVNRSFDNLFGEVNAGIDVTVREATVVDDPFDQGPQAGFEDSILDTVQEVDGVESAEGVIADVRIAILGDDGERIGPPSGGPPHIALSTVDTDEFDALTVVEGESPDAADEVAIDADSAEDEDFELGDTVTITGDAGASEYTIVGITQFGSGETSLGASLAQFTLEEAQRLTGKEGRFDEIDIAAAAGTTPEELAPRVQKAVGPKFDVMTGIETAAEDAGDITEGFSFLTTALLVFAGISVFVGGFLIFNTFSITVVQRTREFAMLRTLGASSRQVLGAVLAEAALIGVLASRARDRWRLRLRRAHQADVRGERLRAAGDGPAAHVRERLLAPARRHPRDDRRRDDPRGEGNAGRAARGAARGRRLDRDPGAHVAGPHDHRRRAADARARSAGAGPVRRRGRGRRAFARWAAAWSSCSSRWRCSAAASCRPS